MIAIYVGQGSVALRAIKACKTSSPIVAPPNEGYVHRAIAFL
jgi:hypothetical protein